MATIERIDLSLPVDLMPFQHDLNGPTIRPVNALAPVILEGADVALFLAWAKQPTWRHQFESDLQSLVNDAQGRKLLTTWMPLVTFRERFCNGGRHLQDESTQGLMERLRIATSEWRTAGVDTVEVSGRAIDLAGGVSQPDQEDTLVVNRAQWITAMTAVDEGLTETRRTMTTENRLELYEAAYELIVRA